MGDRNFAKPVYRRSSLSGKQFESKVYQVVILHRIKAYSIYLRQKIVKDYNHQQGSCLIGISTLVG